jgi:hypothetical protein
MEEENIVRPLLLRYIYDNVDGDWLWSQLYNEKYRDFILRLFFSREMSLSALDEIYMSYETLEDITTLRETFCDFVNIAHAKQRKNMMKSVREIVSDDLIERKVLDFLFTE